MSRNAFGCEPHSAKVDLRLQYESQQIKLRQVCSQFIIAFDSVTLPPGTSADLVVIVDGNKSTQSITLIEGMSPEQSITKIRFNDGVPF